VNAVREEVVSVGEVEKVPQEGQEAEATVHVADQARACQDGAPGQRVVSWEVLQGDCLTAMRDFAPGSFDVREVSLPAVREFIESRHYSRNVNGVKVDAAFALMAGARMMGAALFGALSTTAWEAYAEREADVTELRRLVCLEECPRNTESWFIARCLAVLKTKQLWKVVVSYADPEFGHCGYIYQASNWSYRGQTADDVVLVEPNGKRRHSRSLRTRNNGQFKPFVLRLRKMLERGELKSVKVAGKHIYTYRLHGKHRREGLPYPKSANVGHTEPDSQRIETANRQGQLGI